MEILQALSPNYSIGRKGRNIVAIVNHKTAGRFPGCLTWLCNPVAQASAHYLITRRGVIYQLVQDEDRAWQAGIVNQPDWSLYDGTNPNSYTIGIEHEDYDEDGEESLTEIQYQASLWLHKKLTEKWGIPIDRDHIIGHYRIDSVNRPNCPGPNFPWERLFNNLKGGDIMIPDGARTCVIEVGDKSFPGYVLGATSYFQEGVGVREVVEALNRKISWDTNNFKAVIK